MGTKRQSPTSIQVPSRSDDFQSPSKTVGDFKSPLLVSSLSVGRWTLDVGRSDFSYESHTSSLRSRIPLLRDYVFRSPSVASLGALFFRCARSASPLLRCSRLYFGARSRLVVLSKSRDSRPLPDACSRSRDRRVRGVNCIGAGQTHREATQWGLTNR